MLCQPGAPEVSSSICRSYSFQGGWMVFQSFIGEAVADFLPVHFQLHRPGECGQPFLQEGVSGNASTATGVSGILKVTGRAKPPLFPSGITINGRMLKISLTRC
ncbi:Uncharacterised protein [Escherichia coli]|nr:Uncharacterised protein [Escherichia coli]